MAAASLLFTGITIYRGLKLKTALDTTNRDTGHRDFIENISALYNPLFAKQYSRLFRNQLRPENCFCPAIVSYDTEPIGYGDTAAEIEANLERNKWAIRNKIEGLCAHWQNALKIYFGDTDSKNSLKSQAKKIEFIYQALGSNGLWVNFLNWNGLFQGTNIFSNGMDFVCCDPSWLNDCSILAGFKPVEGLRLPREHIYHLFENHCKIDTENVSCFNFKNPFAEIVSGNVKNDTFKNAETCLNSEAFKNELKKLGELI